MAKMTSDEREQYLAGVHVGVIAVERADRAPLAVPIWYGYRPGGEVLLWTESESVKHKLIRGAGRFAITAQDEQPPYKYVTAEGEVTGIGPAQEADVRAIAVRYLGEEAGAMFAEQNLTQTSIIIRMRPQRWLSTDYSR
jgi:nitroimidazol reductase NimA-like FMN-containing flavoprotein (pyridoxamine 5'-phosphate oxidase superfamily)